jgi:carboxyl-terminal processing protease
MEQGDKNTTYLLQSGVLGQFVFEQLDRERNVFKGLSFKKCISKIEKTDLYFNSFRKYLLENGLDLELDQNKSLIKKYIAAEFARQLYDESKYYEIVLKEDRMIKKVLSRNSMR